MKSVNELLNNYKKIEKTCSTYVTKEIHEKDLVLGGCCHYIKGGKSETQIFTNNVREYSGGQLRKCSWSDKLSCSSDIEYDTVFHRCISEDCSTKFRNTNKPETCDACNRNFEGGLIKNPSDLPRDSDSGIDKKQKNISSSNQNTNNNKTSSTKPSTPPPSMGSGY